MLHHPFEFGSVVCRRGCAVHLRQDLGTTSELIDLRFSAAANATIKAHSPAAIVLDNDVRPG